MKKNKIMGACALALAGSLIAGGTLAYFTDSEDVKNTFSVGHIDIKLDEEIVQWTDADGDGAYTYEKTGERTEDGNTVADEAYVDIYPGAYLPKDPTIYNEGENVAKLRVIVEVKNTDEILAITKADGNKLFQSGAQELAYDIFENFNAYPSGASDTDKVGKDFEIVAIADSKSTEYNVPENTTWYVLEYKNAAVNDNFQESTDGTVSKVTVFDAIQFVDEDIKSALTNETMQAFDTENGFEVNVYAYAVQAEAFPGWTAEVTAGGDGVPAMFR